MHERRAPCTKQACREAERKQEMLAVGFIDCLRMRHEQPVQGGLHGGTPALDGFSQSSAPPGRVRPKYHSDSGILVEIGRHFTVLSG